MLRPYDDLVEIDFIHDEMKVLRHVDGKYFVPVFDDTVEDIHRYSAENMIHPDDRELYLRVTDPATMEERMAASETPGELRARFRYKLLDGGWRWVEQVNVDGSYHGLPKGIYYAFIYDIGDEMESPTADGEAVGERNPLTGLLRENPFFARGKKLLEQHHEGWCLIAIDLENFKLFNEWYGRNQGDLLLASIGAQLMRAEEHTGGLACYFGQDDFAFFAPYDRERIEQLYNECHQLIVERGTSVGFLPAFGVCMADGETPIEELYDHAALAARHAKDNFHTRIRIFDPSMNRQIGQEYQILSDFQKALKEHELFIMLQPQCLIADSRIVGAESLVRWRKADGTMVSPGVFVPVLEKYGFVTDLDKYVWEEVCVWQKKWIDGGHTPLPISVNVSQIDIFTIDVAEHFTALVKKYNLPADAVKVEITESAYVDNAPVVDTVKRLRERGFIVLMDDFGSGYSSLNMLRSLNVDILKLDAQFLRMNGDDHKGVHIMESIVNMAKTMGVPIIVEGVETKEECDFLSGLGCRYVQGYFFYKPMAVADFESLISDPAHIDTRGFIFKAREQFHTREFLDQNVFSDAMLNNILGPVAFFLLHGEDLDCIRYNQQFRNEVNSDLFEKLLKSTQRLLFEEDLPVLYGLLEQAMNDPLGGAAGVLRFLRDDNTVAQFRFHFFFLEEDESGKRFYGSMHDITHLDRINSQLNQVSRLSNDEVVFMRNRGDKYIFQVTVHGLADAFGLSREEFEAELNEDRFFERMPDGMWAEFKRKLYAGETTSDFSPPFPVRGAGGRPAMLQVRFDPVHDKTSGVEYILLIRKKGEE